MLKLQVLSCFPWIYLSDLSLTQGTQTESINKLAIYLYIFIYSCRKIKMFKNMD